jgi:uncharacterized DUF497 family protein
MKLVFDPQKNAINLELRGISFQEFEHLEWSAAVLLEDTRKDYGEQRWRVFAPLHNRLHVGVFTHRDGATRVISLRKANRREVTWYEKEKQKS